MKFTEEDAHYSWLSLKSLFTQLPGRSKKANFCLLVVSFFFSGERNSVAAEERTPKRF